MIFDIHIEPYEIKSTREYKIDFEQGQFPVLQIGKGSYVAKAQIETSLNFHVEDGCYNLQIGKYCSLAEDILFMLDLMHDYKYVSTGTIEEFRDIPPKPFSTGNYRVRRKGQILIQNDVWIGHGATIMGGVTIHNGGVVGAGAVVTKDVPPYSIVAGNPARVVKYRFEQNEIDALLRTQWWHWNSDTLKNRYEQMRLPIPDFINCFKQEVLEREKDIITRPNPVNKNVSGPVFACIADMESTYPVCPKIIREFCERFQNMDGQLAIYIADTDNRELNTAEVMKALLPYEEINCSIQIIDGANVQLIDVIRFVDCYVTNRCAENLYAVEQSYLFHKNVLSGVDIPIWQI